MRTTLDPADLEFLGTLRRLGPRTVQGLGEALGVTATAIRQKLTRLQAFGHVERRLVREGRGRPHHEYLVTDKAMRELGDNYGDLATILWREVQRITDPTVRALITDRVRDALVARLGHIDGESLKERLGQLERNLRSRGYDVEVDEDSRDHVLRENNCPYHELADQDRGICELEQEVFEKVLGTGVTLSRCCLDGHSCCEFSVSDGRADSSCGTLPDQVSVPLGMLGSVSGRDVAGAPRSGLPEGVGVS